MGTTDTTWTKRELADQNVWAELPLYMDGLASPWTHTALNTWERLAYLMYWRSMANRVDRGA